MTLEERIICTIDEHRTVHPDLTVNEILAALRIVNMGMSALITDGAKHEIVHPDWDACDRRVLPFAR